MLIFLTVAALPLAFQSCDDEGATVPLPQAIQDYLDANYANAEIEESEQDTLCDGTDVYEVELEVADDEEVELTFDNEGNLLFTETEIKTADLPAAVTAAIASNYAGFTAKEAGQLATPDGSSQYEVELKNGQTQLEVLFVADGTVICEQEDDDDGE